MDVALVAHDGKKKLMENFAIAYRHILMRQTLYATSTTGRLVEEATNLKVYKYLAGHLGGLQQLGAQISHNQIDMVIFLKDPSSQKPHEIEQAGIEQLCDMHNIPIATNLATAELLVKALERGDLSWR